MPYTKEIRTVQAKPVRRSRRVRAVYQRFKRTRVSKINRHPIAIPKNADVFPRRGELHRKRITSLVQASFFATCLGICKGMSGLKSLARRGAPSSSASLEVGLSKLIPECFLISIENVAKGRALQTCLSSALNPKKLFNRNYSTKTMESA